VIKDGMIYARGSADDKGQFYMHVKAVEAMMKTGGLPCNVKVMIEGEEEVGSDNLGIFVKNNKERLKADVVLISDTAMIANDVPSINTGLRGLSYVEVEVTGPNRDLHSGVYGGAVANPINALCEMIASLHDARTAASPSPASTMPCGTERCRTQGPGRGPLHLEGGVHEGPGRDAVRGEKGYTTEERSSIRPTLDVNGIWGGYIGEGAKTVLPKQGLRQDQHAPGARPEERCHHQALPGPLREDRAARREGGGAPAPRWRSGRDPDRLSPAYLAASKAMEETFGKKPIPTRGGGSIPIVALFEAELGLKTVLFGFGLDSDNIHSPNENTASSTTCKASAPSRASSKYRIPLHIPFQPEQTGLLPGLAAALLTGTANVGVKGSIVGRAGLLRKRFSFADERAIPLR
jgi:acetylornithine deacetylase/succinyl-diaminopimelate desuccinylase-like protein